MPSQLETKQSKLELSGWSTLQGAWMRWTPTVGLSFTFAFTHWPIKYDYSSFFFFYKKANIKERARCAFCIEDVKAKARTWWAAMLTQKQRLTTCCFPSHSSRERWGDQAAEQGDQWVERVQLGDGGSHGEAPVAGLYLWTRARAPSRALMGCNPTCSSLCRSPAWRRTWRTLRRKTRS